MLDDLDLRADLVIVTKSSWLEDVTLPDPRTLGYQEVLLLLRDWNFEALKDKRITIWSIETIYNIWRAAYDLPEINAAIRLSYVVDHYEAALAYDLKKFIGVDLAEMWIQRRWQTLLDYIDRLPSHTWYAQAVSEDEEHTKLLAKQMADAEVNGETKNSPALHSWSPEVAVLTDIHDAIKNLTYATVAMNSEKKEKPPEPSPRPHSELRDALEKAKHDLRKAKHEELAARLLPGRSTPER